MKISLIFTPNDLNPNFKELAFRDDNIGSVPPLSLLYVAAILEKEGVEVDLIDMAAERLTYPAALQRITKFSPDLLGFSISTMSFHPILKWITRFKQDTGLPVLVGGEHVRHYPAETMSHASIDFCIVGEAELPLPQFIRAFREKRPFDGIKSLGFRNNGEVFLDRTLQIIDNIDSVPFPARHLINNELYENVLTRKKNFTAMLSARGCPFNCAFCNANQQRYRARSPKNFVDEIELNLTKQGIRDFDIYDSTFTTDRRRVLAICEEIRRRKLKVGFSVRSRVDVVDKVMIDALKSAGCHSIMYGIESSSPEILRRMNKGISPEQIMETVTYTNRSGLETLGFFMFGFPGESHKTIEDTIEFSLKLPLDYAQFTLLVPFPETEIYSYYQEHGLEEYWAEYTLDESKERLIDLIDTDVTREEVSRYIAEAYRRFYYRPRILWKQLIKLRSFSKLKRLAFAAVSMLANAGEKK
jgi:radical SAM superfamily enzyme YgiQ (UPF0313 family)